MSSPCGQAATLHLFPYRGPASAWQIDFATSSKPGTVQQSVINVPVKIQVRSFVAASWRRG